MTYTLFLGTNPILSASECIACLRRLGIVFELVYSDARMLRITTQEALPASVGSCLGGTFRIAEDVALWNHIPTPDEVATALAPLPAKWVMGISCVGVDIPLRKFAVSIKKAARTQQSKVAFIEPKHGSRTLNAAQVLFNKLLHAPNMDLSIMRIGADYLLIRTVHVQDIAAYELRDTSRPARDARVGMLPPKLAQIMINLGVDTNDTTIYDPFCGMGTILQESWNMGFAAIGTDASERMIESSKQNLAWMLQHFTLQQGKQPEVSVHDVTQPFPNTFSKPITVVTEPFLGTPLTRSLSPAECEIFHNEIITLYRTFFQNIHAVLPKASRLLVLLPAPKCDGAFTPLPRSFIDEIQSIGYRKKQLVPQELASQFPTESSNPILYARPDALVARELTLWETV